MTQHESSSSEQQRGIDGVAQAAAARDTDVPQVSDRPEMFFEGYRSGLLVAMWAVMNSEGEQPPGDPLEAIEAQFNRFQSE